MPRFTESRTRCGLSSMRPPSMCSTRSTKRSVCWLSSRSSTKPEIVTPEAGKRSTGCAMSAVFTVATAKPAAMANRPSATTNAPRCRRSAMAAAAQPNRQSDRRPGRRLTLSREVEDDTEAVGDREPREQPARGYLLDGPLADLCCEKEFGVRTRYAPNLARTVGRPSPSARSCAALRIALVRHRASPARQ